VSCVSQIQPNKFERSAFFFVVDFNVYINGRFVFCQKLEFNQEKKKIIFSLDPL
jgi:hypothetical protein